MWCEQMQDVSGFTADAVQSPSSELADFTSTTSPEYDIYTHDSGYPSPDLWSDQDQLDAAIGEPKMYSEDNYRKQQVKIDDWLGNSDSAMETLAMAILPQSPEAGDHATEIKYENPLSSNATLERPAKPSGRLSVFATEEPRITGTVVYCDDLKPLIFDLPSEVAMDLGGEVEVTTEEESPTSSDGDFFKFDPKEELADELVHPEGLSSEVTVHPEVVFSPEELVRPEQVFPFDCDGAFPMDPRASPLRPVPVGLKLDMVAAMAPICSAEPVPGLPDTPDLMTLLHSPDLLRRPAGFDLVDFIVVEGDANNNAVALPSPTVEGAKGPQAGPGKPWRLSELKDRRKRGWRKPHAEDGKMWTEQARPQAEVPPPGPSRPTRKSAEIFRQRIGEGILAEEASDDEGPKKRRRSESSTSSRRRLDSDKSVREDADKYRLRRDRNNESSRHSREKRKNRMKLKQEELRELEGKNVRLQRRHEALRQACDRANIFWRRYVESVRQNAGHSN